MLECEHLEKQFKGVRAVDDLTFQIGDGELFALLGANGAGKTTTIKMILGLLKTDGGTFRIKEGAAVGYSPETPYFPPFLTARQALGYYARLMKMDKKAMNDEISRVLEVTGLEDTKTKIRNYSKGMTQRLGVAQALLGSPDFLILDEPTAGLDAYGRTEMISLLRKLKESGRTILLNSHILADVERICDRALIMKKGVMVLEWSKFNYNACSLEEIFIEAIGGKAS